MIACEVENCRDRPPSLVTGAVGGPEVSRLVGWVMVDRVGASVKVFERSEVADNRTSLPAPRDISPRQAQEKEERVSSATSQTLINGD